MYLFEILSGLGFILIVMGYSFGIGLDDNVLCLIGDVGVIMILIGGVAKAIFNQKKRNNA